MHSLMQPVSSSNISHIGYSFSQGYLVIMFKNGGLYSYSNVPVAVYQELIKALSKGKYFIAEVRDKYPNQKIDESDLDIYLGTSNRSSQQQSKKTRWLDLTELEQSSLLMVFPQLANFF